MDFASGDELDVGFLCATDMGDRFFSKFDARLPVRLDHITPNVWIALASLDHKTVVAT